MPRWTQTLEERFWAKVDKRGECWIWLAARNAKGYGVSSIKAKPILAHRLAYIIKNGPISDGLVICHSCDNPSCVNPAHLRADTQQNNLREMARKGRSREQHKTHCPNGHPYSQENTLLIPGAIGKCNRRCIECTRLHSRTNMRRYRAAKKEESLPLFSQAA